MLPEQMPEFIKLLTGIGLLYGKSMHETVIEIYWKALESFDLSSIEEALQAHIKNPDTGQYLPKPADVVRYLQGGSDTQALKAWSTVMRTISRVGIYGSVIFDDPIIHVVLMDMGGWIAICKTTCKELPFRAQEFVKRYAGYVLHPPDQYPKKLIGLTDAENSMQGYLPAAAALVGDPEQAQLVYQNGGEGEHCHQAPLRLAHMHTNDCLRELSSANIFNTKAKVTI